MQMTDGMMKRLACLIIVSGDDFGDVSNMAQRCNKDAQVCTCPHEPLPTNPQGRLSCSSQTGAKLVRTQYR